MSQTFPSLIAFLTVCLISTLESNKQAFDKWLILYRYVKFCLTIACWKTSLLNRNLCNENVTRQTRSLTELSEDRIEQIWIGRGRGDTWFGLFSVSFTQSNNLNEFSLGEHGSFWCQTLMLHNVSFTATSLSQRPEQPLIHVSGLPTPTYPSHTHTSHTQKLNDTSGQGTHT